jgi:hypothetical protein
MGLSQRRKHAPVLAIVPPVTRILQPVSALPGHAAPTVLRARTIAPPALAHAVLDAEDVS